MATKKKTATKAKPLTQAPDIPVQGGGLKVAQEEKAVVRRSQIAAMNKGQEWSAGQVTGSDISDKTRINKGKMLDALEYNLGIVTPAAEMAGISRETHYAWMKEDPDYKAKVESFQDVALDFAERKLIQSIKRGSDTANIFYLKTKGKKRGYIERTELDMSGQLTMNWNEVKNYNGANDQADHRDRHPGGQED